MTTRLLIEKDEDSASIDDRIGSTFSLSADESHYISRVLRLSPGDQLIIINPHTTAELLVKVLSLGKSTTVEIMAISFPEAPLSPVATLLYPLTKGSTIDLVLEKGCELGVSHFIIWQAERSVVRLGDPLEQRKKVERWGKILRAASQQSLKIKTPALSLSPSLEKGLAEIMHLDSSDISLWCSLSTQALPILERTVSGKRHHIVLGPEGDFSAAETALLAKRGFLESSLGPYRLRAETAALAAVAMVCGIAGFSTVPATR